MKVSIFGLGYVGAVAAGCLARDGHEVIGCDASEAKVDMIRGGHAPVIEDQLDPLIAEGVASGRLRATTDAVAAVAETELSLVSVGTPSRANGSLDLTAVRRVAQDLGAAIAAKGGDHRVVLRSTVLPGTTREVLMPLLAEAAGQPVPVCFNPEFLREGSSVKDFYSPPFTLVGADDRADAQAAARLYGAVSGDVILTALETAELVKYVCNAYHALKVAFGNEIGAFAKALGVDGYEVMQIFCRDDKLNCSPRYLMPGFAFGGSCLPKDLRALLYRARELDVELPLLGSVLPSNQVMVQRAVDWVLSSGRPKVGLLGLSFKAGTDDLRESPLVTLTEALLGKGLDVRIYDQYVSLSQLVGANRAYLEQRLPHVANLLADDLEAVIDHGEVLIIGNNSPEFSDVPGRVGDKRVLDLVRLSRTEATGEGLGW